MGFFNDFFYFSKKQRNGIIILVAILLLTLLIRQVLPLLVFQEKVDFTAFKQEVDSVLGDSVSIEPISKQLFYFDPNHLSVEDGLKLGFTEKNIAALDKYLSKGGTFNKPEDFKKMYFVNDSIYELLYPFIKIEKATIELPPENVKLFYFNPNNLPEKDWLLLGFKDWQIRIIKNYESKGGYFYNSSSLKGMYGVDSVLFNKIEPYIIIYSDSTYLVSKNLACDSLTEIIIGGNKYYGILRSNEEVINLKKNCEEIDLYVIKYGRELPYDSVVDFSLKRKIKHRNNNRVLVQVKLNDSDTTEWKKLKGIGSKLSNRIIERRTHLRGYLNKEQIKEIYGISDSLFLTIKDCIIVDEVLMEAININTCDYKELVSHPYINSKVANSLINYREVHGNYKNVQDIKASVLVNDELYLKIAPYLKVD